VFVASVAYSAANTVFQQIQAGVGMIASILLFGLGVALLRKRIYRVYEPGRESAAPPPVTEQAEKPLSFLSKLR